MFYILEEGKAYAHKVLEGADSSARVKEYKAGDFFGELALINNEPRAASVKAEVIIYLILFILRLIVD